MNPYGRSTAAVEGELRYREFNDKKHKKVKVRLAEIHLGKIGKLDHQPRLFFFRIPLKNNLAEYAIGKHGTGTEVLQK